jgi:hypothetical protein
MISKPRLSACEPKTSGSKRAAHAKLAMKVSEKGALSVYGMGRFPVTLYKEQWLRLLAMAEDIKAFIEATNDHLRSKE